MGMFDFISKAGAKLGIDYFEKQEAAKKLDSEVERVKVEQALRDQMSAELTEKVIALGLDVDAPTVRVRANGVAHVAGTARSQAGKEKLIVFVGNHEGISQVNDDALTVVVPEPPGVLHRVRTGDTLSLIAKHYYGIIMAYPQIATANQQLIKNVDALDVHWVIRVPPISGIKYTVKQGDTLGGIAKTMYGDAKLYTKIFEASRDVVSNADVVTPGMELTVPVLHALQSASA